MTDGPLTYRDAGVDRDAVAAALATARAHIRETFTAQVIGDLGHFAGLFHLPRLRDPVLVSTIDGAGTKALLARDAGRLRVVGHDVIAHGANDIAVVGATPLFALDYLAAARLDGRATAEILEGMAAACREEGIALVGGETAQMPGVYTEAGLDVVACVVGVGERDELCDGSRIRPGDVLVGMASSGLHTNGFSLVREIMARRRWTLETVPEGLSAPLEAVLLAPHRSYRRPLQALVKAQWLRAAAHITGGGIPGNLVRVLPEGCCARVETGAWTVPPIFRLLSAAGKVERAEMLATFNMGIGMIAVVPKERAGLAVDICRANSADAWIIGDVVAGKKGVEVL